MISLRGVCHCISGNVRFLVESWEFWCKKGHSEIRLEKSQDAVAKWFLVSPQTQDSAHDYE